MMLPFNSTLIIEELCYAGSFPLKSMIEVTFHFTTNDLSNFDVVNIYLRKFTAMLHYDFTPFASACDLDKRPRYFHRLKIASQCFRPAKFPRQNQFIILNW